MHPNQATATLTARPDVDLTAIDIVTRAPGARDGRTTVDWDKMRTAWLVMDCAPTCQPPIRRVLDNRHRWEELGFASSGEALRYLHAANVLHTAGITP